MFRLQGMLGPWYKKHKLREALMTFVFKHPKYYKELRKRNRDRGNTTEQSIPQSDQAISDEASTEATSVRPGPGPKLQAATHDLAEATGLKPKRQAASSKI